MASDWIRRQDSTDMGLRYRHSEVHVERAYRMGFSGGMVTRRRDTCDRQLRQHSEAMGSKEGDTSRGTAEGTHKADSEHSVATIPQSRTWTTTSCLSFSGLHSADMGCSEWAYGHGSYWAQGPCHMREMGWSRVDLYQFQR